MPTFTTFALADRDYDSPLNEDVVDTFILRDEDLRERPVYLELAEVQEPSASYVQRKAWQIYVPATANQLYVAIQVIRATIPSGEVQCKIGALTSTEVSTTNTAYGTTVFDCIFSDLSTVQGTEVTLTLEAKITGTPGGGRWVRVREADGPASYFVE